MLGRGDSTHADERPTLAITVGWLVIRAGQTAEGEGPPENFSLGTPSSRRESHPPALTDPDVTISRHPARIIQLNERQHQPASGQIASVNVF